MKSIYGIALAGALFLAQTAHACDFCGCLLGLNPYYSGSDQFLVNFLYQRSDYNPPVDLGGGLIKMSGSADRSLYMSGGPRLDHLVGPGGTPSHESRSTIEIAFQHHFSERLMVTATLPAVMLDVQSAEPVKVRGLGDPTLLAQYMVVDRQQESTPMMLMVGGGLKLPLGATGARAADGDLLDFRSQPGSGSFGLVLNGTMTMQWKSWTLAADLFGTINVVSADRNRLGNSLGISSNLAHEFYRDNVSQFALMGIAGLRGEAAGHDLVDGAVDGQSGFVAGYATLGSEIAFRSLKFDVTAMLPVYQHRNEPYTSEHARIVSGIRYEF
jgi:hypothetical protein